MRVFGIDFTSAPRAAKPITCAVCTLHNDQLVIDELRAWTNFDQFESFLSETESSLTGIDLPLGQPRRLVQALGWPTVWEEYVKLVGAMSKQDFVATIKSYCNQQPAGDKHHLRQTDELAKACSPMMLYGVPVGKMFFEGAPRIGAAGVSVLPCRPNESSRIVVEAYPALVARRLIGRDTYKNDSKDTRPRQSANRRRIINSLRFPLESDCITVSIENRLKEQLISDHTGDSLDAVLSAIQVATARARRGVGLGIPGNADPVEGWIVGTVGDA